MEGGRDGSDVTINTGLHRQVSLHISSDILTLASHYLHSAFKGKKIPKHPVSCIEPEGWCREGGGGCMINTASEIRAEKKTAQKTVFRQPESHLYIYDIVDAKEMLVSLHLDN